MWKNSSRERSAATRARKLVERRRAAGLADTREQHAIRIAQAHIALGEITPREYITPKERFGEWRYKDYVTKRRHGVSLALYIQAFLECMCARAEKREPVWRNLDLVDNPQVAFTKYQSREAPRVKGERKKANRTSDGPIYDDGAPTPDTDDWEPGVAKIHYAPPSSPEHARARAKARRAYKDTYDRELGATLRAIDKPRSLI